MILSQEKQFGKAVEAFEELIRTVRRAQQEDRRVDLVEREVFARLLRIGFEVFECFVAHCGNGDLGETLPHDGHVLRRSEEPHERRYVSLFGEHRFQRYVYMRRRRSEDRAEARG